VSLFVLSLEIEDRDEVEVVTERSTKRLSSLNEIYYSIFKRITKKIRTHLPIYFFYNRQKNVTCIVIKSQSMSFLTNI
jgi:hypothetical protein